MRRPDRAWAFGVIMSLALGAPGLCGPPDSAPPAKVVRRYALTSANDFPQRDPQDWRLLGSNDDGKSWTTLDTRKGEVFSERHQRRVFKVANPASFFVYRLQIDRVRNPAAADAVQLAEIEPLGETEDDLEPAPLFTDAITAQGNNPPLETCWQAFDGEVETKWLDHATPNAAMKASWVQWKYTDRASLVITNLKTLAGLRSRAGAGYPVRIEAVLLGRLPKANTLVVLDASGPFEIPDHGEAGPLSPGQQVLVEGMTQWTGRQVALGQCRLHALGSRAPDQPRLMVPEEPLAEEQEFSWVEAEGQVRFCTSSDQDLAFELEDSERTLWVRVVGVDPPGRPELAGAHVRVQGLCRGLLNDRGERVAGGLWAAGPDAIVAVTTARTQPGGVSLTNRPTLAAPGAGLVLTNIEQILRLGSEELARTQPKVKVRGVVTELFGSFMQEGNSGVELWLRGEAAQQPPAFGVYVEVEGKADWAGGHGPIVRAEKAVTLGRGKLPPAERCAWSQLASGKMVDQWIEISAVVHSTDGSHLLLTCEGGQLMATIRSAPAPAVARLVDATVRVRGVCVAASDSRGQVQGIQLLVPSLEFVAVEEAPADPFSLPTRPIGSLLQVRGPKEFIHRVKVEGVLTFREGRRCFLQDDTGGALAITQEAVILDAPAGGRSWMFWQSANSNSPARDQPELRPGDRLQVVGFPETHGYAPVLTEVMMRKVARSAAIRPVTAKVSDITSGGLDSTLVTLEAVLLRKEILDAYVVLELQSEQRVFQALLPKQNTWSALTPGSRLRVTGVCQIEPLPYAELGKRVASFKLLVGSAADLLVLDRPSWWTLKRALVLTGSLVVVLAIAAGWIGILHRQVEERTKRLQREIEDHKQTEARLAEEKKLVQAEVEERKRIEAEVEKGHKQLLQTSRLAGMAEVATNVLHNVGNVLNSVNVLASSIAELVQGSKVPSVNRLAGLLSRHRADLSQFITQDPQGRELPGFVERLAAHLAQEQDRLVDKTKALTESIQHIKEIVAMQQNYAKISGVLETVRLAEIIEDALRIHDGALARHQIRVVRQYEEVPPVTLDRHKVLQILFNLLENAKHACDAGPSAGKRVTVRIRRNGGPLIRVEVADNGVGIPAENLTRIFAQEFSTRKSGHGFGLHSSILAAQDMGATLTAHSDGPGKGATFILDVPIVQPALPA